MEVTTITTAPLTLPTVFTQSLAIAREEKTPAAGKKPPSRRQREAAKRKTRRFAAEMIAVATADALWNGGKEKVLRPVWAMFAGTDQELPIFMSNLRTGKVAEFTGTTRYNTRYGTANRVELLKSVGYHYAFQHIPHTTPSGEPGRQSVVCAYLPDLFAFDPGMVDPEQVCFLTLTPRWWVDRELEELREDPAREIAILKHAHRLGITRAQHEGNRWKARLSEDEALDLTVQASLWAARLDKRTMKPLVPDPAFCLHIYLHALKEGLASFSRAPDYYRADDNDPWDWARSTTTWFWHSRGLDQVGLCAESVATYCTHAQLDDFLSRQIKEYFLLTGQQIRTITPTYTQLVTPPPAEPLPWDEIEDETDEDEEEWADAS